MRRAVLISGLLAPLLGVLPAAADTTFTFTINATIVNNPYTNSNSPTGTLTGTLTIDKTNPENSTFDISAPGTSSGPYTAFNYYFQYPAFGYGNVNTFLFVVSEPLSL
jgi:hypothetical protein